MSPKKPAQYLPFQPPDPDAWKHGVAQNKYRAVLHIVHHGLAIDGTQRCIMCGTRVVDHSRNLLGAQPGTRLDAQGNTVRGFRMGPVTTVYPPEPDLPPVTVQGHVKYARPCTIPESEWRYA